MRVSTILTLDRMDFDAIFQQRNSRPRGKDSAPRISTPSELSIIAALYTTFAVVKFKPEKNSGLNGIRTHDTGAVLYEE